MIILEEPYVSELMLNWLEKTGHPILSNAFAESLLATHPDLSVVGEEEALALIDGGQRIYTCLETALDWVLAHSKNEGLCQSIVLCKDKAAMRQKLAPMDPALFFRECTMDELLALDPATLPFPVVVKPSVGFVSFGVHVVANIDGWQQALDKLRAEMADGSVFPDSVISGTSFVVEGFISGQEYAVDVYFDEEGAPTVVDVMQHDFAGPEDTTDHLYFTSGALMTRAVPSLEAWFAQANQTLGFKDFCSHVELRVSYEQGQSPIDAMEDPANIHVIEFNPLRFAGFSGTDLSYFAFGYYSYQMYLEGEKPQWDAIFKDHDDYTAVFVVMEKPDGWHEGARIDYAAIERDILSLGPDVQLCELRPLDPDIHGLSCFPMLRAKGQTLMAVFDYALNMDADRYLL